MKECEVIMDHNKMYNERRKFDLPAYRSDIVHQSYPMNVALGDDLKGCIVFPLFQAIEGIQPEYHITSALWAAHSFLVNTNVREEKVPIFFYVDRKVWENVGCQMQFKQAGIPMDRIILWDTPEREYGGQMLALKLCAIWDYRLAAYKNVLIVDTDLFIATRHEDKKFDINHLWQRTHPEKFATSYVPDKREQTPRWHQYFEKPLEEAIPLWKQTMLDRFGLDFSENSYIHQIGGYMNAFCPKQLNPEYTEFVKRAIHACGDDEDANSLWMIYSGEKLEDLFDVWPIRISFSFEDVDRHSERDDFHFVHVWPKTVRTDADIEKWRVITGQYKDANR